MASLLGWLGKAANTVYHGVSPFDGGQGWTNQAPRRPSPLFLQNQRLRVGPVQRPNLVMGGPQRQAPPLRVGVAPQQNLRVGNQIIRPNLNIRTQTKARNEFLQKQLHPSILEYVKRGLEQKLMVPKAAVQAGREVFLPSPAEIKHTFDTSKAGKHPGLAPLAAGLHAAAYAPFVGPALKGAKAGLRTTTKTAPIINTKKVIEKQLQKGALAVQSHRTPLNQSGKLQLPFGRSQNFHYSSSNGRTTVSGKANAVRQHLASLGEGGSTPIGGPFILPGVGKKPTIFGKDGVAWKDYNKRYSGVSPQTAKTKPEFDAVSAGSPKMFGKTPDAIRLKDTISGDKRVGYVDNQSYNSLFAKKAKEAGLYTQEWNGVTLAGKNKADVIEYATKGNKLSKQREHYLIGYKHERFIKPGKPKVNVNDYAHMSPEELAQLGPTEQMAVAKTRGMGPPSKAEIASGLKANPYKSNVRPVEPGNWVGARTSGSAVAHPIRTAHRIADSHLERLGKADSATYSNFWKAVEGGKAPKGAPKELQPAIKWFREVANAVHKESNALGTPTRYHKNWELRAASLKDVTPEQLGSGDLGAAAKHAIQRKYGTHEEFVAAAEKAGLKVEKDPRVALQKYVAATSSSIERRALAKSLAEADRLNPSKPHTVDLGWGTTVKLSDEGLHQAKGIMPITRRVTKAGAVYDAANSFRKGLLLSVSQFHTVNIAGLRAAPSLIMPKPGNLMHGDLTMGVHPVRAARGLYGTGRALVPRSGKRYVNKQLEKAYARGDVQFAARHGTPFGQSTYGAGKRFNIGHKKVFEEQLPMMHKEVVGALRRDLGKYGIAEGSPQAMEAGKVANFTMGFINRAAMNMSPTLIKTIERTMLAGQFTPSKLANLYKGTTKMGLAGSYARADVAANAITAGAMIVGVGWLVRQKSDDVRDLVLKSLINPAIPTPYKDKKGNTQEIRIPMTYTAEVAHILGIKLTRQKDGHLGVSFSPKNMPETLAEWARARLSPNLGDVVKVATNTEFGNKPLYEEGASLGKQATQIATKTIQGGLPIGAQGVGYTDFVKKHVPAASREVLEAGTPSTNPLLKSLASSTGFTTRTDRTTGKALDSGRYFSGKEEAKSILKDDQSKSAFDLYTGAKKNSVTDKYNVAPTVWDTISNAASVLRAQQSAERFGNKGPIDALIAMNKKIVDQGGKVDPLFQQSKDKIQKYFEYQGNLDPFSNQRKVWYDNNKSWYQPLSDARGKFFKSLPPGDPNKPTQPVEYPNPSSKVQSLKDQYYKLDGQPAFKFMKSHPELQKQFDDEFNYKNDLLKARGATPYKAYPKAAPLLQGWIDRYMAGDKAVRRSLRDSSPSMYKNMSAYFDSVGLYNINKEGAVNQLQGQPDQTSKQNKAISNLARDIYQNAAGTYNIVPAGWMDGLSNSSSGYGYSSGGGKKKSSGGRKGSGSRGGKPMTKGFKTAGNKKPKAPKGIKVKKLSPPKLKSTRKLSVTKIPSMYKSKKIA